MTLKKRYELVIDYFLIHAPNAETELKYNNTYQLLVAVILSAQCTDKRINLVTPALFEKYPTIESLSNANSVELFGFIKSVSYPNNKTNHLLGMAKMIQTEFKGNIPMNVNELMMLPGVGRKTANVLTSVIQKQPNMAVDTHVFRVSARIGLTTKSKSTLETERQLIKNLPSQYVHLAHHWLILHGRYICKAKNPLCEICGLKHFCRYYGSL